MPYLSNKLTSCSDLHSTAAAMVVITRAKKRRLGEEERLAYRISSLPDGVLGDIISLLPTKDGARTQVLSSRWRHLWRSAPLNLDLLDLRHDEIPRVLSSHPGPGRRFSFAGYLDGKGNNRSHAAATLDSWLRSPALDSLQELEFQFGSMFAFGRTPLPPPLPASVHRFSPTLCVARFSGCSLPDDGNDGCSPLQLPLLKQLTLFDVSVSESSLHALLAGCPVLQSLLLLHNGGFPRLQIVSSSLRSIGVHSGGFRGLVSLQQLSIEDAPRLERLLYFGGCTNISIINAPKLAIVGKLMDVFPRIQFGATVFQGSTIVSMPEVVRSVKVLTLYDVKLCMHAVINLMKCFPDLKKLYIKLPSQIWGEDWRTYHKLMSTLDIGLRKIVLRNYQGSNESCINLARLFVSNARVLESMRFELQATVVSTTWTERQCRLLQIENRASRGARFDFVPANNISIGFLNDRRAEQVQDLSADPFHMFH